MGVRVLITSLSAEENALSVYLDAQEVFTAMSSCNESIEKDEIGK